MIQARNCYVKVGTLSDVNHAFLEHKVSLSNRIKMRWPYLIMYVLLGIVGIIVLVVPSITISESIRGLFAHIGAYFFIVGGGFSTFGLLRGALWGEATGLPMAASATLAYGIVLVERYTALSGVGGLIIGMLFIAYSFGLLGRWIEVMRMLDISRRIE